MKFCRCKFSYSIFQAANNKGSDRQAGLHLKFVVFMLQNQIFLGQGPIASFSIDFCNDFFSVIMAIMKDFFIHSYLVSLIFTNSILTCRFKLKSKACICLC